jgi:hypothetical protein
MGRIGALGAVAAMLLLSGCGTTSKDMDRGLGALMGREAKTAFAVLGYPDGKEEIEGDTVYSWQRQETETAYGPGVGVGYGTWGRGSVVGTGASYGGRSSATYYCKIKLVADKGGVLKHWEWDGDMAACDHYARKLKAWVEEGRPAGTPPPAEAPEPGAKEPAGENKEPAGKE